MLDPTGFWYPHGSFVPPRKLLHALLAGRSFSIDMPGLAWSCIGFTHYGSFCIVSVTGEHSRGRWHCGHGALCTLTGDVAVAVERWSQIRVSADCRAIFARHDDGGCVRYTSQQHQYSEQESAEKF